MPGRLHPLAGDALAAEAQVIDIGVEREIGPRLRAWPGRLGLHVAQRLPNKDTVAVGGSDSETVFTPQHDVLNVLPDFR